MEILFDDDDLEPMGVNPTDGTPKKLISPEPIRSEASLFGDLEEALGLEPVFAPAPVQKARQSNEGSTQTDAQAQSSPSVRASCPPLVDPWAVARKVGPSRVVETKSTKPSRKPRQTLTQGESPAYLNCPPVSFDEALFAPEEVPEPPEAIKPKITRTSRRSEARFVRKPRAAFSTEEASDEKIIRTPDRADAFTVIRDDGTVLEVDRDTCADPEVFARERERRRRRRASGVNQVAPEAYEGFEGFTGDVPNTVTKKREKPKKSLLTRAIDALSRREYSRKDLERKLSAKLEDGETRESLAEALDRLESLGLLSDERFAEAQVRASAGRMGDYRLRRTLRQSGVSEEAIDAALETVEEPEEVRALRMWRRRWSEPPKDWKEREKMTRFLMTRGFGMSAIQKVLRGEVELPEDSF